MLGALVCLCALVSVNAEDEVTEPIKNETAPEPTPEPDQSAMSCSVCAPGFGVISLCNGTRDTMCAECLPGDLQRHLHRQPALQTLQQLSGRPLRAPPASACRTSTAPCVTRTEGAASGTRTSCASVKQQPHQQRRQLQQQQHHLLLFPWRPVPYWTHCSHCHRLNSPPENNRKWEQEQTQRFRQ